MERISQLVSRYDSLPPREKILLGIALLALMVFLADLALFQPLLSKQKKLMANVAEFSAKRKVLDAEIDSMNRRLQARSSEQEIKDVEAIAAQADETEARLRSLIAKRSLNAADLGAMLESAPGVQIRGIRTGAGNFIAGKKKPDREADLMERAAQLGKAALADSPLGALGGALPGPLGAIGNMVTKGALSKMLPQGTQPGSGSTPPGLTASPNDVSGQSKGTGPAGGAAPPGSAESASTATVYRSTIEMELSGNYLAVLDYLKRLDGLEIPPIWNTLSMQVGQYPTSLFRIQFNSYSTDSGGIQ